MKDDVTKLLTNYVKAGFSLTELEKEMIKSVEADLKQKFPEQAKQRPTQLNIIATDLVRAHIGKRVKEKITKAK